MTVFGNDLSVYQPNISMSGLQQLSAQFFFSRSSAGAGYVDPSFKGNLAQAKSLHTLFAPYHFVYQGVKASYKGQADTIEEALGGDKSLPLWFDVEESKSGGTPTVSDVRAVWDICLNRGYDCRGVYFPQWYWEKIGRPDLTPFHNLMASKYWFGYKRGDFQHLYAGDANASLWQSYGGLQPVIAQFTSSLVLPGYTANTVDADAYRGSFQELRDGGLLFDFGVERRSRDRAMQILDLAAAGVKANRKHPHLEAKYQAILDVAQELAKPNAGSSAPAS